MNDGFYGPVTTDLDRALGQRGWLNGYGCVSCQRWHYEGDEQYATHIGSQSKHGIQRVRAEIVADCRAQP